MQVVGVKASTGFITWMDGRCDLAAFSRAFHWRASKHT